MEALMRTPYQGVLNIVRFNWHFYAIAGGATLLLFAVAVFSHGWILWIAIAIASGIMLSTLLSLAVSHYIYDRSGLYRFAWLHDLHTFNPRTIANIHAGFDETSHILKSNFPKAPIQVFDFYDPTKHTEVSIERARKAYPPYEPTQKINTTHLPVAQGTVDIMFNIFALHEIRNRSERVHFLMEQMKGLTQDGCIILVEHNRDLANFLAYNIGFFHFLSPAEWRISIGLAGLHVKRKFKITPFITVLILTKNNGNPS